jgi:hypothetical protein
VGEAPMANSKTKLDLIEDDLERQRAEFLGMNKLAD